MRALRFLGVACIVVVMLVIAPFLLLKGLAEAGQMGRANRRLKRAVFAHGAED